MNEFSDPFEKKGPKRRPGPNDEEIDGELLHNEEETAEETALRATLPPLVTASELLPPDPLEALPVSDEEAPPDDVVPTFIIVKDAYGPGSPSVKLPDGTPVGVWLDREHHDLTGAEVTELLESMGLDELYPGRSAWFGKTRDSRRTADDNILAEPALAALVASEAERRKASEQVRAAYLDAHKKKEKKT